MKNNKKTEIKVGVTAFAAILLIVIIYGWAKNFSINSESKKLNVEFSTVAGLELGNLVSVNGVRKGLVDNITSSKNSALVTIKFTEEVELKEDAKFSIMMLDLMGGKKIEINSGNANAPINFSETQIGNFSGDISTAMATLSSVETDLVEVIKELKLSLENMNYIFNSEGFLDDVKTSASNLNTLTENMNNLLVANKKSIEEILSNTKELTSKSNRLIDKNEKQIFSILNNLDSTIISSNYLINNLNKLSEEVVNSENNIGKLLYDDKLFDEFVLSLQQIREMTNIINKQLKSGGLEVKADVDLF